MDLVLALVGVYSFNKISFHAMWLLESKISLVLRFYFFIPLMFHVNAVLQKSSRQLVEVLGKKRLKLLDYMKSLKMSSYEMIISGVSCMAAHLELIFLYFKILSLCLPILASDFCILVYTRKLK